MRSCGYAYAKLVKRKGDFGMKARENFQKKISEGMGQAARDFSEKIFSGTKNTKFCATLVAPRAAWV